MQIKAPGRRQPRPHQPLQTTPTAAEMTPFQSVWRCLLRSVHTSSVVAKRPTSYYFSNDEKKEEGVG